MSSIIINNIIMLPIIIIIWRANHPSSQLHVRSELWRTRLHVREAGMQGVALAASHINPLRPRSTAKDRKCLMFPEGGKPDGLENPRGTAAENKRTTQLTYGPGRESNQGHLGERWALQAQANHATQIKAKVMKLSFASIKWSLPLNTLTNYNFLSGIVGMLVRVCLDLKKKKTP